MIYLEDLAKAILQYYRIVKRKIAGIDKKISNDYFDNYEIRKLHIGCGAHILKDWLNSDCYPISDTIIYLDATKPLFFNDNQFNHVFTEHMIEHITYQQGLHMLAECYRVLKVGGRLRVSTPNLSFLVELYANNKSEIQNKYLKWMTDNYIKTAPYYDGAFVINAFMREWGHKFIYDEEILRYSLSTIGFVDIKKCYINVSEDSNLCNLENDDRMPVEFLGIESIILEATKRNHIIINNAS